MSADQPRLGLRPLVVPACGAAVAAAALLGMQFDRAAAAWTGYALLDRHAATGSPGDQLPAILYAVRHPSPPGEILLFGCLLAFVAVWVLRARRNAGSLAADRAFHHSPALAVAGVLVPFANLWFPGPVIAEIADVGRPTNAPRRPWLDHAWWPCWVVGVVIQYVGDAMAGKIPLWYLELMAGEIPLWYVDLPAHRIPTADDLAAQLALALLWTVASVAFAAAAVLLGVVVVRVTGRQARLAPAARPGVDAAPPTVPRAVLARAVACAAVVLVLVTWPCVVFVVGLTTYDWAPSPEAPLLLLVVVMSLAVLLAPGVVLGVVLVRFARRPRRSAVPLVAALCALAWMNLAFGWVAPVPEDLRQAIGWSRLAITAASVAAVFLVVKAVRPPSAAAQAARWPHQP